MKMIKCSTSSVTLTKPEIYFVLSKHRHHKIHKILNNITINTGEFCVSNHRIYLLNDEKNIFVYESNA